MHSLLYAVAAAGLALLLAASMAARGVIRHPRRSARAHEEEAARVLHRGLMIHIAVVLAACAGLIAFPALGPRGFALFVLGLFLCRVLGFVAGNRHPGWVQAIRPLLAPIEGATLLIDWVLSPVSRRMRSAQAGTSEHRTAYEQVLSLTRRTVEQVMIPRSKVVWLKSSAGPDEIAEVTRRRPHSRYPVFEGDAEQLVGTLELFDLLRPVDPRATAGSLARAAVVVPETMGCDALVEKMRGERFDSAVVIDEFGGVAGLVTLEDLLEVIVGELAGEHETIAVRARPTEDGAFLVDGTLRLEEFEEMFGVALPDGEYETLAGLFLSRTSRIPGPGERVDLDGVRLEVAEVNPRRILSLKVTVGLESQAAPSA